MLKMIYPNYRERIHPKLAILDDIDARLWFDKKEKYFLVEFNRDEEKRPEVIYKHSLMSNDPVYINSVVQDFIKEDWDNLPDLQDECLRG